MTQTTKNCTNCHFWTTQYGCQNTNWITGKVTNPAEPVCVGLTFKMISIKAA